MRADIRIRTILLIEKIKENPEFARKIVVKDNSYFRSKQSKA